MRLPTDSGFSYRRSSYTFKGCFTQMNFVRSNIRLFQTTYVSNERPRIVCLRRCYTWQFFMQPVSQGWDCQQLAKLWPWRTEERDNKDPGRLIAQNCRGGVTLCNAEKKTIKPLQPSLRKVESSTFCNACCNNKNCETSSCLGMLHLTIFGVTKLRDNLHEK